MIITIHEELKTLAPNFKVGVISYSNINVHHSSSEIQLDVKAICDRQQLYQNVTDIVGIKEGRQLFKMIGTDPSKYRPSSEALLRRVLKGDPVPSIHSAADVNNLFSIKYAIPIGIYDFDKLSLPIEIRVGDENDLYEAINNRETNMKSKLLSADKIGPFGSPIVDSKRTMVTPETKNALQIIYFHPELPQESLNSITEEIKDYFLLHHGGTGTSTII
ncbi:hypothetical protein DS745_11220 [Anaerobacillus alkaliphilus]|uniref:B3/B4 tRNA-binding domain-containing protein n=1 Tax=Anaerobacillus alkaliphilus TaxID=1548597 RepID=A0A4Q0VT84_9BACI|nr:phenylalanine--tRNA ligase beta subunit-related protein [Anaerobacillus alkaliphilus]RXJ00628.1 hypothetical protein DS745_11220 [Anaerobacillus alkaliphilus]